MGYQEDEQRKTAEEQVGHGQEQPSEQEEGGGLMGRNSSRAGAPVQPERDKVPGSVAKEPAMELATFAGGCFWCMVTPFEELPGIVSIESGYTGGHVEQPTYEQVKTGTTGHAEAVQIRFQPELFPYERLLELYWQQVDPTDAGGQFQDRGSQYRTGVFYHTEQQKLLAEQSRQALAESGRFSAPIVTEIEQAGVFYRAEEHHQDYHKKNPAHYKEDRKQSGRDEFLGEHWKG